MQKLHESQYSYIHWHEAERIMEHTWKDAELEDDIYKTEMLVLQRLVLDKHPEAVLGNTQQMDYAISPEMQEWINREIIAVGAEDGYLKKTAVVIGTDIFAHVSIEQTLDEAESQYFQSRFFDNRDEAWAWLTK